MKSVLGTSSSNLLASASSGQRMVAGGAEFSQPALEGPVPCVRRIGVKQNSIDQLFRAEVNVHAAPTQDRPYKTNLQT
jgi:hypothetical protein